MSSRRASTLIELTVTMSVGSSLMILAVGFIHQAMSLSSTAHSRAEHHRTMDRLSKDFRHDVHLAADCSVGNDQSLRLDLEDGSVVQYSTEGEQTRRELRVNDATIAQEEYALQTTLAIEFEILGSPRRVSVSFQADPDSGATENRSERRITAVLGRTLAHQQAEVQP